jgi:hypothetical protein
MDSRCLKSNIWSILEKEGMGLLFDRMYRLPNKVISYNIRSRISVLKASIKWELGFVVVVFVTSLLILKSLSSNQSRLLRQ